jgi:hypothetical protein
MFDREPKPFVSPTMPFGSLDAHAPLQLARRDRASKPRGIVGSMIHGVYDIACVCIDAIIGRYDR